MDQHNTVNITQQQIVDMDSQIRDLDLKELGALVLSGLNRLRMVHGISLSSANDNISCSFNLPDNIKPEIVTWDFFQPNIHTFTQEHINKYKNRVDRANLRHNQDHFNWQTMNLNNLLIPEADNIVPLNSRPEQHTQYQFLVDSLIYSASVEPSINFRPEVHYMDEINMIRVSNAIPLVDEEYRGTIVQYFIEKMVEKGDIKNYHMLNFLIHLGSIFFKDDPGKEHSAIQIRDFAQNFVDEIQKIHESLRGFFNYTLSRAEAIHLVKRAWLFYAIYVMIGLNVFNAINYITDMEQFQLNGYIEEGNEVLAWINKYNHTLVRNYRISNSNYINMAQNQHLLPLPIYSPAHILPQPQ